jgi:penicillin-binding protein 1A
MQRALKGVPEQVLETPTGVVQVRINPDTGLRDDSSRVSDYFLAEFAPRMAQDALAPAVMPGAAPARDVRDQLF